MMTSVTRMGMNSGWLRTVCISVLPEQRSLRKAQERLGVVPYAQRRYAAQRQGEAQAEAAGERRRLGVGIAIEHAAYNLEVVIDRHRRVQRGKYRQRVVLGLNQRQENVVLAQEARGGRNACQREQENQHQEGVPGVLEIGRA